MGAGDSAEGGSGERAEGQGAGGVAERAILEGEGIGEGECTRADGGGAFEGIGTAEGEGAATDFVEGAARAFVGNDAREGGGLIGGMVDDDAGP